MNRGFLKEIRDLFLINKKMLHCLLREKKLFENLFLDNSIPEDTKYKLLDTYNPLMEVIDKRFLIHSSFLEINKIPDLLGILYNKTQEDYLNLFSKNLQNLSNKRNIHMICFTLENVNLEKDLVEGLLIEKTSMRYQSVTMPKFILNIGTYSKFSKKTKINQLMKMQGYLLINPINNLNQAVLFDILSSLPAIKNCILPFSTLSFLIISEYLSNSNRIFLLPEIRGLNPSAIQIEKKSLKSNSKYSIKTREKHQYCNKDKLYFHVQKLIRNKRYLVVQGKDLLFWNGVPLEARVYIQKGIAGKWSITKMIGKNEIFLKDSLVYDTVDELETLLVKIIPEKVDCIIKNLANLSLNICTFLDYYIPNFGNFMLDFIFDEEGSPFILHVGGWDSKNYLLRLNGKNLWDQYIRNAIDYLLFLQQKRVREDDHDMG